VVIRAGALGDVLLGFPALDVLRELVLDRRLILVAPLPQARLALRGGRVDEVVAFDDPALVGLFAGTSSALPAPLDGVIEAVIWMRSHEEVTACLRRLGVDVVMASAPVPPVPPVPAVRPAGGRSHAADWLIHSLSPLGVEPRGEWDGRAWLQVTVEQGAEAERLLAASGIRGEYVVLHPGSGSPRKNWPVEMWLAVLQAAARGREVVVTAGPADDEALALLAAVWPGSLAPARIVRAPSLDVLAGILSGAALYAGNDSGVTHLAAAVGAPTLAVFGPTDPVVWRPRGPRVVVLGGAAASGMDGIFAGEAKWPRVSDVIDGAQRLAG